MTVRRCPHCDAAPVLGSFSASTGNGYQTSTTFGCRNAGGCRVMPWAQIDWRPGEMTREQAQAKAIDAWDTVLPTWETRVRDDEGMEHDVHIPRDDRSFQQVLARLADEGKRVGARWEDFHSFKGGFVNAQAIYAQTLHTSQGSTHRNTFLDIPEIRVWARRERLEAQRGLYVGMTRPSHTLTCVGVA